MKIKHTGHRYTIKASLMIELNLSGKSLCVILRLRREKRREVSKQDVELENETVLGLDDHTGIQTC